MADKREKELSTLFQLYNRTRIRNKNGTILIRYLCVCEKANNSTDFIFMTLKILKSEKEHMPSQMSRRSTCLNTKRMLLWPVIFSYFGIDYFWLAFLFKLY